MSSGLLVQLADQVAGGGEHHRVQACRPVGLPGAEDVLGHGGQVAHVHPLAVQVEAQRFGVALAQRERGGAFGRVTEPHQFAQLQGTVLGSDVAQDAAGADGGELLIVPDQPHAATTLEDELHRSVQGQGVGHPGLVDHHEGGGVDAGHPVGELPGAQGVGELGERVGLGVGLGAHRQSQRIGGGS